MEKSEQVNEVFGALAKAKAKFKPAELDGYNSFTKSKYSTLDKILEACTPALTECGLICSQLIDNTGDDYYLTTMVAHSSGQWFSTKVKLMLSKADMQALGAAITYARRQGIEAMLGIGGADEGAAKLTEEINKVNKMKLEQSNKMIEETKAALDAAGPMINIVKEKKKTPLTSSDPITANDVLNAGEFVCTFGPNKGKKISEMGNEEISKQIAWIEKTKPPRADSLNKFLQYGKAWLNK